MRKYEHHDRNVYIHTLMPNFTNSVRAKKNNVTQSSISLVSISQTTARQTVSTPDTGRQPDTDCSSKTEGTDSQKEKRWAHKRHKNKTTTLQKRTTNLRQKNSFFQQKCGGTKQEQLYNIIFENKPLFRRTQQRHFCHKKPNHCSRKPRTYATNGSCDPLQTPSGKSSPPASSRNWGT